MSLANDCDEMAAYIVRQDEKHSIVADILLRAAAALRERHTEADELSRLRDENQRFRNGYANLFQALQNAPGLPLEAMGEKDLAEWTDVITGILMALGTLDATGKPVSPWEALCAVADRQSATLERK